MLKRTSMRSSGKTARAMCLASFASEPDAREAERFCMGKPYRSRRPKDTRRGGSIQPFKGGNCVDERRDTFVLCRERKPYASVAGGRDAAPRICRKAKN